MPIDWTAEQLEAEQAAMRGRNKLSKILGPTYAPVHDGGTLDRLTETVDKVLAAAEPDDERERRTR